MNNEKKKIAIILIVISTFTFLIVAILKIMNYDSEVFFSPEKQELCIDSEKSAIEYLNMLYGDLNNGLEYKLHSYESEIYNIALYNNGMLSQMYSINSTNCNVSLVGYFGEKVQQK